MKETRNNSRRDFLKIVSIAAVTIGSFSFLRSGRSGKEGANDFKTLSAEEADRIIREEDFPVSTRVKPMPAPEPKRDQQDL